MTFKLNCNEMLQNKVVFGPKESESCHFWSDSKPPHVKFYDPHNLKHKGMRFQMTLAKFGSSPWFMRSPWPNARCLGGR